MTECIVRYTRPLRPLRLAVLLAALAVASCLPAAVYYTAGGAFAGAVGHWLDDMAAAAGDAAVVPPPPARDAAAAAMPPADAIDRGAGG